MTTLRATARLQFHRDFPIDRATDLVPYFQRLGISHLYASPLLMSRPGSTHGYDIVDHNRIDPELGGENALRRLVAKLRMHDMGLILDIVPNHMGVGGADNAWWLDVLEWGRASDYAEFFDIDWDPPDATLRGKLLAPFLGASYGDALINGDIALRFDSSDGRFFASIYDTHRFPIAPRDYPSLLRTAGGALDELILPFAAMPAGHEAQTRHVAQARETLRTRQHGNPDAFAAIIAAHAPTDPEGRERLHKLLERQHYRLAWWRAAADEINWRRFFDINGLAGVRVERGEVFDATHATVLRLYAEGLIDGVRIDHVDGLADPRGYCRKLRRRLEAEHERRPSTLRDMQPVLWVEKILAPNETLLSDWLTDGTTGYDFMSDVSALQHAPCGEAGLTSLWTAMTGRAGRFASEAEPARRQILREALSSELWATAAALHRITRRNVATRDWTLTALRRALEELLVHFPAYRIYAGPAGASESDARAFAAAMDGAKRTVRAADRGLLDLIGGVLTGNGLREVQPGLVRQERLRAMVRFQQLSAPTAAKAVEDTAFYRYGRLLSRNEVGADPAQFALSPAEFHALNRSRRRFPRALLTTATHDHKRGEDTRSRLAVLSEIPAEWDAAIGEWVRRNLALKRDTNGTMAPDAADELMLYQTIVAAWPTELAPDDQAGLVAYRDRVSAWLEKAMREAKRRSEWAAPNEVYESAAQDFLRGCLDPTRPDSITGSLYAFAARIAAAGAANALAQSILRMTCPGVPDLYQGTEFWDFSLVDPDNRRPVNFAARQAALKADRAPGELAEQWRDGRVKQALIARVLALRARTGSLFADGSYVPVRVEGHATDHVFAFIRQHEGRSALVAVTRTIACMLDASLGFAAPLTPPATAWKGSAVTLPRALHGRDWVDALSGASSTHFSGAAGRIPLDELFASLPVAVLEAR